MLQAETGITRTLHRASPGPGVAVWSFAYYTEAKGGRLRSVEQRLTRSDTIDAAYLRDSVDNGRTWSEPTKVITGERRPNGMWRKHLRAGVAHQGRLLEFWNEGLLPTDDPLEGLRQWQIHARLDGTEQPLVGEGFTATNPWPGVYQGKNCAMVGDQACAPVTDGKRVLVPVELTLFDAAGKLYNPGGGYTYHDAALLIGTFEGGRYRWRMTKPLKGDPARTTRGLVEPTIVKLSGQRWLMVLRGSNDRKPGLPSHRWYSLSEDGGETWREATTWTYTTGEPFFSPSACSQLLKHSSGRIFWLGNITAENPRGNRPRYPFWIGEVDRATGLLRRESLRKIDDRQPGEDEALMLSNFYAREDRVTREIVLHMSRLFPLASGWAGDAFDYRIRV
ncbi:MAG: glycoside hydrolase [Bryobacteraceae bacterium]|nr:glycoside hydrolase [Bryobacteraceae bacterium]